jgi:hypothetical protein
MPYTPFRMVTTTSFTDGTNLYTKISENPGPRNGTYRGQSGDKMIISGNNLRLVAAGDGFELTNTTFTVSGTTLTLAENQFFGPGVTITFNYDSMILNYPAEYQLPAMIYTLENTSTTVSKFAPEPSSTSSPAFSFYT